MPDHPRPVQHLLRPQPGVAPCAQLGVPRPCAEARADRRHRPFHAHHAAAPDSGGRGAGGRGSDLRPAQGRLRPAPCLPRPVRGPDGGEEGGESAPGKGRGAAQPADRRWRPSGTRGRPRRSAGQARSPEDRQLLSPRRHEGGRRTFRRRQDAASLRVAIGGDHEGGGGLSRALHGQDRRPGERHHRSRHRQGRRPRYRQEPGRHHPDE